MPRNNEKPWNGGVVTNSKMTKAHWIIVEMIRGQQASHKADRSAPSSELVPQDQKQENLKKS